MAYDWKADTNVPETAQLRGHRVGWLTRFFAFMEELFAFTKKSGDYNRKV